MKPDVVVDVGNTRIKWGRCSETRITAAAALPPDDPEAWEERARRWRLPRGASWVLAGVHPPRCERLGEWLHQRGDRVLQINSFEQLPLKMLVEEPETVGLDRLFNAVAVPQRRPWGAAIIIDAGSAVTVDLTDESGAFRGGAILPGLHMMVQALHEHTALLPLITPRAVRPVPGTSTASAIEVGVYWAVVGAIHELMSGYFGEVPEHAACVFLTGGDAPLFGDRWGKPWPRMTLEGIRLTAESLP